MDAILVFWIVFAIVAIIGEVFSMGLVLGSIGLGAIAGALTSLMTSSFPIQLAVFAGIALLGIGVIRPILSRTFNIRAAGPFAGPTHQEYIVGRRAIVTQKVDADTGQIRFGGGEFWSARSVDPDVVIEPGSDVRIEWANGITAYVTPVQAPASLAEEKVPNEAPPTEGVST